MTARCRCSSSTPDMTRSPSPTNSPTSRPRCSVGILGDRVFYSDPPPRPKRPQPTGGRPPRHGNASSVRSLRPGPRHRPAFFPDARHDTITDAWHGLSPRLIRRGRWAGQPAPPTVKGTVIRVDVEHPPKPTARTKKTLWLWWSGQGKPDLERCWRAYLRRLDIEHTSGSPTPPSGGSRRRCADPSRRTAGPGLSSPITLSYGLLAVGSLIFGFPGSDPRSRTIHPNTRAAGFRRLRTTIGTPASPPKDSRAGPGRPKGTRRPPRTRYPSVN